MGFSFGFSNQDLSDDEIEQASPAVPVQPSVSALSSITIEPQNLPKKHSLQALLDTLVDVRLTFDNYTTPIGQNLVYRRELFDVKHQLMTEDNDSGEGSHLIESNHDLQKNIYEGGFKSWECSYDMVDKLAVLLEQNALGNYSSFLELGCGTSLPICFLLMKKIDNKDQQKVKFILSDFNYDVLRLVSLPNLLIHWASTLPLQKLVDLTTSEQIPMGNNDELLCTKRLLDAFVSDMDDMNVSFEFISGSWGPQFNDLVGQVEFVITSETIYSLDTLPVVAESIVELTKDQPNSYTLVAAKNIYFGVGGSVIEFLNYLKQVYPEGKVRVEEINDSQLKRSIIHINK